MAQSKQWKAHERECSKDLGGERTGPTGKDDPDITGVEVAVECKYQKRISLKKEDLKQAQENADKKSMPWVLALREAKTGTRLAVLDWKFFVELYKEKYVR